MPENVSSWTFVMGALCANPSAMELIRHGLSVDDRMVPWNGTSWLLPFGELFVAMNFVVWTFGGFDGRWMHRQVWNICHGMERHGFWG